MARPHNEKRTNKTATAVMEWKPRRRMLRGVPRKRKIDMVEEYFKSF